MTDKITYYELQIPIYLTRDYRNNTYIIECPFCLGSIFRLIGHIPLDYMKPVLSQMTNTRKC